jgi:hypothetical protein
MEGFVGWGWLHQAMTRFGIVNLLTILSQP